MESTQLMRKRSSVEGVDIAHEEEEQPDHPDRRARSGI